MLKSDLSEPTYTAAKAKVSTPRYRSKSEGLFPHHEGEVSLFHQLLDLGVGHSAHVDTAETVVRVLVDRRPTHRGRVKLDTGRLDQVPDEVAYTVPDCTGVQEDDRLLGFAPEPRDLGHDKLEAVLLLLLDLLPRREHVLVVEADTVRNDRRLESLLVDRGEDEVGGQRDIRRSGSAERFKNDSVDLGSRILGPLQERASTSDSLCGLLKDVESAIAERVVQQRFRLLQLGRRDADNVQDGDTLRVGAGCIMERMSDDNGIMVN